VLRFNDNRIRELSPAVSLLDELDELDLTNNDLGTLPPELGLLTRLRWLGVEGNMLRMIRRPVIERGTKALLEYLRDKLPESFVVS
jgi:Leucine-rich repeat (LRR) protein